MSRTADIDFHFVHPVTVTAVVGAVSPFGWSPREPLGVSYLIDEDDDFDWERGGAADAEFIVEQLDSSDAGATHVGISLFSEAASTGGTMLFFPGRRMVSFTPSIYRRQLVEGSSITDIAWYLGQFAGPLATLGLSGYEARDVDG
ncbi:hypothetical protein [Streptomyces montanisoli]|uniref:Uncharacterized protein n=1 Tax=Streptomyces montanisoli TaxID=2798581 RepID=A0A940M7S9_9ACTN|nr:hypothetical protein [Streptomyces montanisoli]MBP0456364.1 hypothetical protein [Streptomyces montanisoli]